MGRIIGVVALCIALWACDSAEPEATAPEVTITAPTANSSLTGIVSVTIEVSGADVAGVELYVDQVSAETRLGTAAASGDGVYQLTFFTAETANGNHQLIAQLIDNTPQVADTLAVLIANRPRADVIPTDAIKMTPATDAHPPVLESTFAMLFDDCAPLPGPVNTAGAEDAPYITADGQELYFFFTPDVAVPPQEQLLDGVTGIYRARRDGDGWAMPQRVFLSYHDDVALDGCETILGDELWFCTARAGVKRSIDIYRAHRDGAGHWLDWESVGDRLNLDLQLGELHLTDSGDTIYYHSDRAGGQGGIDLWVTHRDGDNWSEPENLTAVNTEHTDGWPWVSADGLELWFTHGPAAPEIWRSLASDGQWEAPAKVVAPFAGEPTFDSDGNLYFTHHFWDDDASEIIEADIYMCQRR